jgi:hypothetical protein
MRVGIIQSNFIPWRGYFDFIDDVDLFIFYDDVQFTKNDWRNRNIIKTEFGKRWLTVPVKNKSSPHLIKDTPIDYNQDWTVSLINRFTESYKKTPFFFDALNFLEVLHQRKFISISEMNRTFIQNISDYLHLTTPFEVSWQYSPQGNKTARIIDILQKVGADVYLSGPSGNNYLEKDLFYKNGIQLEIKSYSYSTYPQPWGDFIGDVTILDLIANCGPDIRQFLKSTEKNRIV